MDAQHYRIADRDEFIDQEDSDLDVESLIDSKKREAVHKRRKLGGLSVKELDRQN